MKILITSSVDPMKSAHSRLHEFLRYLSEKHKITVLSINDWWKSGQTDVKLYNEDFRDMFEKIDILYLTNKKISPIFQEIFSIINSPNKLDGKFDIHLNYASFICGYSIAKKTHIPTVYDIADDWVEMTRKSPQIPSILRPTGASLLRIIVQKNIKISTKITYTTKFLKNLYRIPDEKSTLIPNGVDTNLFRNYGDTKEELGLEGFIIGYVGVLREWVDLEPVFRALQDLNKEIKIVVVGKEGQFKENVNLAKNCGVYDRVIFTGMVPYSQVPKYISAMDICLIPFKRGAISENALPLKLFEYMACEKPVLSTELPGVKAIAGDKVLYASTRDEYREKISELYRNEELSFKLGEEGRQLVKENYDWEKIVGEMEEILSSVKDKK